MLFISRMFHKYCFILIVEFCFGFIILSLQFFLLFALDEDSDHLTQDCLLGGRPVHDYLEKRNLVFEFADEF